MISDSTKEFRLIDHHKLFDGVTHQSFRRLKSDISTNQRGKYLQPELSGVDISSILYQTIHNTFEVFLWYFCGTSVVLLLLYQIVCSDLIVLVKQVWNIIDRIVALENV